MAIVTVLGSGTSVSSFYKPFDFRGPAGYLLQHNDKNYLLDCSEGIRARLDKIKVDYYSINNIFISHFHPDHFSLVTFMQSFMGRALWGREVKSINVYGPPEIEVRFKIIWDAMHNPGNFDTEASKFLKINFYEYKDGVNLQVDDDLEVTPFKVNHANMQAYSLRFNIQKKVLTYSGDSGSCPGLEKAASDADLFICEANQENGDQNKSHLTVDESSLIALNNKVKKLALTHLPGKNKDAEIIDEAKKYYPGDVVVAHDFDVLQL